MAPPTLPRQRAQCQAWLLVAVLGVASLLGGASVAEATAKGAAPVAHWTFNEGGGGTAYDESSGNYDGTLNNGATWTRQGKVGNALSLDGTNDYVNIASTGIGNFTNGTVAAWIYPTSLSGGINCNSHNGSSSCKAIAFSDDFGYFFGLNSDGALMLDLGNGGSWLVVNSTAAGLITTNAWQHVALTVSGTTVKYYVNGVLRQTNTVAANSGLKLGNFNRLGLGGSALAPTSYPFTGRMDDVRLYNYTRTDEQILMDYNAGAAAHLGAGTDPNEFDATASNKLVGYWPLDDNTLTMALDKSGSGNNGTLTSGPAWAQGKYGSAVSFDGVNDYIDVPVSSSINYSGNTITMSAWVYPRSFTYGGTNTDIGVIVQHTSAYYLSVDGNGKVTAYFQNVVGSHTPSNSALPLNTWSYVAVTYDGSNIKWYINGLLDKTLAASGSFPTNAGSVKIGGEFGYGRFFNAIIDNVRIYNYARSDGQIAWDYNRGKPVAHYTFDEGTGKIARNNYSTADTGAAPVGWWRMDTASSGAANGASVTDESGNANTGTADDGANNTGMTWAAGKLGLGALSFDGVDDTVAAGNGTSLSFGAGSFTISAWAKTSNTTNYKTMVCKGLNNAGAQARYYMRIEGTSGKFHASIADGTNEANISGVKTGLHDDVWHHYAMVVDRASQTMKTYVDGAQDDSVSVSAIGNVNSSSTLKLGVLETLYYFAGTIDDVRIFNYARTAEQVYNDYKASHMTLVADTKYVDGKFGKALTFDGSGDFAESGPIGATITEKTLMAWVKLANLTQGGVGVIGIQKDPALGTDQFDSIVYAEQTANRWMAGSTGWQRTFQADAGTDETSTGWVHMAITYKANDYRIYRNGVQIGSSTAYGLATYDANSKVYVGKRHWWATGPLTGSVDDARLYNYALTQEQILQVYNAGAAARLGTQTAGEADPWGGALPINHWKLDDNTGVLARDASGNGNDGTLTNGPTWTQGKNGPALNFDGTNDYVSVANSAVFDFGTGNYTMEAWLYTAYTTGDHYLWSMAVDGAVDQIGMTVQTGNIQMFHGGAAARLLVPFSETNQWVHLAMVRTGNTVQGYKNGIASGASETVTEAVNTSGSFIMGAYYDTAAAITSGALTSGKLDDVRVYNYARTPAQIAWDYNRGKPVAHYRFNEGSGTTAYDEAKTNNGTITIGGTGSQTTIASAWTAGATGKFGKALNFDGTDDYVIMPNSSSFNFGSGDFTVSWWEYRTSNDNGRAAIVRDTNNAFPGYLFGYSAAGANLLIYMTSAGSSWDIANGKSLGAVTLNTWNHFLVTRSGTTFTAYKNGAQTDTWTSSSAIRSGASGPQFGRYQSTSFYYYQGMLDDVRLYNYARTAEQILQDFLNGSSARLGD